MVKTVFYDFQTTSVLSTRTHIIPIVQVRQGSHLNWLIWISDCLYLQSI